ncbi:MAG: gamma-glutamyltransferase [Acidobacteriales bacterium]|nr:gamma-glutamyltransferase [Terriglobales bacterium]
MKAVRNLLKILLLAAIVADSSGVWAAPLKPSRYPRAMVASIHELASKAGADIMKAGGNAVDAAVATGFALAVVYPEAGNIGGGGFMLVRMADGTTRFLDFREKAPKAATKDMFLDAGGKVIKDTSSVGYKAIGVPGTVAGLVYAQRKWGRLKLDRVMRAAILLAKTGFTLEQDDVRSFREPRLSSFPEARKLFQRNGNYYEEGESFQNPDLARVLEEIAKDPDSFYRGKLAREISEKIRKGGGLITEEDLATYEAKEREPVRGHYRGYEILSAPPPSSGGIALIETLNILEGFDLSKFGARSADAIHLTVEAMRRAMFDRAEFLGDPDFNHLPVAQLLDKKYASAWREGIEQETATPSRELQRPAGAFQELDQAAQLLSVPPEPEHTTHYSVIDPAGNAVAVTYTVNDLYGSGVVLDGMGFILNDEMDDFSIAPNHATIWGATSGKPNQIEPGKRPLSAMTPTIVVKDGKPFLILGARGGIRIISTVINILSGVVDYGMNIQEAVNAPRFHHQWSPDSIRMEKTGFSPDTLRMLSLKGHKLDFTEYWSGAECIQVDPKTGERLGGSDGRYYGKTAGF